MAVPIDPGALDALARHISAHADDLRSRASRLAAAADGVRWHSTAAGAFRADARGLAGDLRRGATRVDDAAHAMRRHAATVRHVQAVIGGAEHAAAAAARGVGRAAVGAAEKAGAAVTHLLGI
jgi:hypothetical protein